MTRRHALRVLAILTLSSADAAAVHHGSAALWDPTRTVSVTGTVLEFRFINPHVQLSIDVKRGSAPAERWHGELTNPIAPAREVGWTRHTFKPGDVVTLVGYPARDVGTHMAVLRVLAADGAQRYPAPAGTPQ